MRKTWGPQTPECTSSGGVRRIRKSAAPRGRRPYRLNKARRWNFSRATDHSRVHRQMKLDARTLFGVGLGEDRTAAVGNSFAAARTCGSRGRLPVQRARLFRPVVQPPKNHFARSRLMNRGDLNIDALVDQTPPAIDHHHGAVVQISDTLVGLLA